MSFRQFILGGLFSFSAMAGGIVAQAATDGTLGLTSTGIANITITVARELRVSNLNDIALGTFNPAASPLIGTDTVCVYDNGLGGYQITLSSLNGAGNFQMRNGTSIVTYGVEYDDTGLGSNFISATEGVPMTARANASTTDDTCITSGSDNATVRVRVTTADTSGVDTNGTHTDTLTLLVAPSP